MAADGLGAQNINTEIVSLKIMNVENFRDVSILLFGPYSILLDYLIILKALQKRFTFYFITNG